ncbi:GNAT family N-acetyltransferase [Kitasatospora sp. A2-31]|uniref:GNAT family N-acetyltransferase n=1 Tax=Kitasatospora sp. A2-31 TaxID=2916414 RepID=UPI001EEB0F52|nr:GNAT family N-acetyltransferase [Kitasatospora sp. A2-31]MCG6497158.1 GNAT family N-acetyltransferase [Kitasatospora sp. A2-31]
MGNDANGGPRDPGSGRLDEGAGAVEIRAIAEDEIEPWDRALALGFLRPHVESAADYRRLQWEPGRLLAAVDDGRFVATFRSFDVELTVPGGAVVPANAITSVTVSATHRRRGLLRRMMSADLAGARARGAAVAILIAAEYNIYGRYGFGPATRGHGWNVDLHRTRGLRAGLPTVPGGRIDFASMAEMRKLGPELHDRWRLTQPGALARDELWWKRQTGEIKVPGFDWKEPFAALHRDAAGTVTGAVVYKVDDNWDGSYPNCTLTVLDFLALDRATACALWQFVFSVDWVRKVVVENIGPDDPLPLLLEDPRAATPYVENADFTWLRVLDVEAAFDARTYGAPGRVVLEVEDREGWAAGRWALEVAPDGTGRCTRTADEADLALSASQLGALYLGGETVPRLAAAGLVTELRPGAVVAADLLLRTPLAGWNPDGF